MGTTTNITIGSIILAIAATLIIVMNTSHGLRIDISKTDSKFYINESGNWTLRGYETWSMYINGLQYTPSSTDLNNTLLINNKTLITRTAIYTNMTVIDTYLFDGNEANIEQFPLTHTINITCKNCTYKYFYNMTSPRMKLTYDKPDSESNNLLIYNTVGNRIVTIRMFDPLWNVSGNYTPNTPSLDPNPAYVDSLLNCSIYLVMSNFTNISYTPGTNYTVYFWYFKNNVQITRYNSITINNTSPLVIYARLGVTERMNRGDVWHCRIRVATTTFTSPIMLSNYLNITNTAPTVTLVKPVNGSIAYITTTDPVSLQWLGSDLENDSIRYEVYGG